MNIKLKGEIIKKFGSQFAFAHAIKWHEGSVSRIIRGHQVLDDNAKRVWADALGIDLTTLFKESTGSDR